jgi:hypothetical protein
VHVLLQSLRCMNTECTTTSAHGKPCARASAAAAFVCSVNASKPLSVRYCIGDRGLRCDGRAYSTVVEGCVRYSVHTGGGRKALTIALGVWPYSLSLHCSGRLLLGLPNETVESVSAPRRKQREDDREKPRG